MIAVGDRRQPGLDGLRGLAVLAVVAFHAGLSWIPGGYLGVDAFFVLSGFLITRLLLREVVEAGQVDLVRFWARRLSRLVPALVAVIAVVVAVRVVQEADALQALGRDAAASLLYAANWRFLQVGEGYFGATAEPSLLQHTWSLAIEEQFYLLWPILLVVLLATTRTASQRVPSSLSSAIFRLMVSGTESSIPMGPSTQPQKSTETITTRGERPSPWPK